MEHEIDHCLSGTGDTYLGLSKVLGHGVGYKRFDVWYVNSILAFFGFAPLNVALDFIVL